MKERYKIVLTKNVSQDTMTNSDFHRFVTDIYVNHYSKGDYGNVTDEEKDGCLGVYTYADGNVRRTIFIVRDDYNKAHIIMYPDEY